MLKKVDNYGFRFVVNLVLKWVYVMHLVDGTKIVGIFSLWSI